MWYLRTLIQVCQMPGCEERPAVEVVGDNGMLLGKFCWIHGDGVIEEYKERTGGNHVQQN